MAPRFERDKRRHGCGNRRRYSLGKPASSIASDFLAVAVFEYRLFPNPAAFLSRYQELPEGYGNNEVSGET